MKILAIGIIIICSLFLYLHRGSPITLSSILNPSYGTCGKCGMPWNKVKYHITNYTISNGCFPLCEECWQKLTPKERLPYYRSLYDRWSELGRNDTDWEQIKKAVLEGK